MRRSSRLHVDGWSFLQSVVEERDRAGPRHFGTLTKKLGLSAPGAR
ncbi:hypothetical protein DFP93_103286 [Aneurinibacillus soli]|nr:hypothetical protein [Aneurinibacillus soli]PYE63074.1 hypothetical protein DFP93_103286 [Aneurinibacillus soli]